MLFKKRKPLTCICGSEHVITEQAYANVVLLLCVECKTRNYISQREYEHQFDDWLNLKMSKLRTISKLHQQKN